MGFINTVRARARGDKITFPGLLWFSRAPGSDAEGRANILMFPDRMREIPAAGRFNDWKRAQAYGAAVGSAVKSAGNLSGICGEDDIVGVAAITALQAQ